MSFGQVINYSDLRCFYKLENTNDSGPNGFNLTNVTSVTFVAAKFGNGGNFSGSEYLTYAGNPMASLTPTNYNINLLYKFTSTANTTAKYMFTLATEATDATGRFVQVYYSITAGVLTWFIRHATSGAVGTIGSFTMPLDTKWHYMSITKLTTNSSSATLAIDGIYRASAGTATFSVGAAQLNIGSGASPDAVIDSVLISENIYSEVSNSNRYK